MLFNSWGVCVRGAVYLYVCFPLKRLQYVVCPCLHALGVGWGREGVTPICVWTRACDAELGSSAVSSLLLPTPPHQRHSNILRVGDNCAQRGHRASHRQQPAAREKSQRSESASPPPVPRPPWPRTAGTETVGVSSTRGLLQPAWGLALCFLLLGTRGPRADGRQSPGLGDRPQPSGSLQAGESLAERYRGGRNRAVGEGCRFSQAGAPCFSPRLHPRSSSPQHLDSTRRWPPGDSLVPLQRSVGRKARRVGRGCCYPAEGVRGEGVGIPNLHPLPPGGARAPERAACWNNEAERAGPVGALRTWAAQEKGLGSPPALQCVF